MTEKLFGRSDFVTKPIHVTGDEIMVVGGSFINTYDDRIIDDLVSVEHGE